jgi:4-hydroxy-2-oxoheptanedioate aldolase
VSLGYPGGGERLSTAVQAVRDAAATAKIAFGGWSPTRAAAGTNGLGDCGYLIVGSDLQILAAGLRDTARGEEQP